jgi:hypothetical protein
MYINRGATSCRIPSGVRQPVCMPVVSAASTIKISPGICIGGTMSKFDIEGVQELGAKINVELGLGRHLFAQRP